MEVVGIISVTPIPRKRLSTPLLAGQTHKPTQCPSRYWNFYGRRSIGRSHAFARDAPAAPLDRLCSPSGRLPWRAEAVERCSRRVSRKSVTSAYGTTTIEVPVPTRTLRWFVGLSGQEGCGQPLSRDWRHRYDSDHFHT